jgi:CCR4-NOT transcriptional complex subunit CAF120
MAPIASQSPQLRPVVSAHAHSRSSSFFSFLGRQSSSSVPHRPTSVPMDVGARNESTHTLSPRINSPPTAANPPTSHNTPSPQQSLQQQPHQMARTPPVQSPLARDSAMVQAGTNAPSIAPPQPPPGPPPLHPEIRSIVQLTAAHAHKIYFSGPLVRRIERQSDGHKPHKDEGWCEVWAQLGGTTLSIWDMKLIQEANKRGEQVPPVYVNVTDAVCVISVLVCSLLILAAVRASPSSHGCSCHRYFSRTKIS